MRRVQVPAVMSPLGVVMDGKLAHAEGVLDRKKAGNWLG